MRSVKRIVKKGDSAQLVENDKLTNECGDIKQSKTKKNSRKILPCIIRLLDDSQAPLEFSVSKDHLGRTLLVYVCTSIGDLAEYDYFGLRYRDKFNQEQWLDLSRSAYKQLKRCKSRELCFRLKHYPSDPVKDLKQNFTRYLVYLQIRRDLAQGRLACPSSMVGNVGALVAQAELGDAPATNEPDLCKDLEVSPSTKSTASGSARSATESQNPEAGGDVSPTNYLNGFTIFASQSREDELEIMKKHQQLRGLTAQEAESELLIRVSKLPTYGIVPFPVTPHHKVDMSELGVNETDEPGDADKLRRTHSSPIPAKDRKFYLGISGTGLVTFIGLKKVQEFPWDNIQRLGCDGKQFVVHLKKEESSLIKRFLRNKTQQVTFDCESSAAALAIWRWAVDRKCFFTLREAKEAKRLRPNSSIFNRNQSYRFSGRSYQELNAVPIKNTQTHFVRVSSMRNSSQPENLSLKYATLPGRPRPRLNISEEMRANGNLEPPISNSIKSAEHPNAVIVPDTVMEQPMEEATLHNAVTSGEELKKCEDATTLTLEAFQTAEEPSLQMEESSQQHSDSVNERATVCDELTTQTDQEAEEIRKRVDSNMVHSVVYEQVISTLGNTIDNHVDRPNDAGEFKQTCILNGEIPRNNGEVKMGSIAKEYSKIVGKNENNDHSVEINSLPNSEMFHKHTGPMIGTGAAITTVVLVVLAGLIVILESTPTADSLVMRFMRSSSFVSGFDAYIYSPVRNLIVSGLSLIWS